MHDAPPGPDRRPPDPAARRPRFRRAGPVHAAFAIVAAIALVGPQVVVSVAGTELFPFTCAPMFAHHLGRDEELYAFRFHAETPAGVRTAIRWEDVGLQSVRGARLYFARVHGSADAAYPVRAIPGDTPDAYAERAAAFFEGFVELARRACPERLAGANAVVVSLERIDASGRVTGTRDLGRFEPRSRVFTPTPQEGLGWAR